MTSRNTDNLTQLFQNTRKHIETLISGIPLIKAVTSGTPGSNETDEFKILEQIPLKVITVENRPLVATAFCGPSGAGKSTVFNLLTNLDVPAGGAVRPMTYASLLAIPDSIKENIHLESMFPGFDIIELGAPADLRNPSAPVERLFHTVYKTDSSTDALWACLVDVPDFNTTELSNWAKAEQMIRRADSVVFTVYHEAYKSQKTFEMLKRVLHLSGNVTWLLTKLDEANTARDAFAIREDLLKCAGHDPDFQALRADGQTLFDFLQQCPFYYSAHNRNVCLSMLQPLANTSDDFKSHIFGQKGLETVIRRQLQGIVTGVECSEAICIRAKEERTKTSETISEIEKHLQKAAAKITGEEIPVFRILAMIRRTLDATRPSFLKRAFKPLLMVGSGLKAIITSLRASISRLSGIDMSRSVMLRDKLERSRLHAEVENLVESWRRTPEFCNLGAETCRYASDCIMSMELPPVDSEWETSVSVALTKWQANNKNLWLWMNVIDDLFILMGAGLFAADFFIDGGIGSLGVVAVIGGTGATGGFLLSLFNNMGLGNEILEAHKNWKKMRQEVYRQHLGKFLAGPLLLDNLVKKREQLAPELIDSCIEACQKLKEISQNHEIN
ncbi:MAG: hypothetical protein EOM80_15350 [Erysipelotrichia bacterium]|nr:hypothetical protein [Erysipelotrichia bacterium]